MGRPPGHTDTRGQAGAAVGPGDEIGPHGLEPLNPVEVRYRLAFYILAIFTLDIA